MTAKIKLVITGGTMAECVELWDRIKGAVANPSETAPGGAAPASGSVFNPEIEAELLAARQGIAPDNDQTGKSTLEQLVEEVVEGLTPEDIKELTEVFGDNGTPSKAPEELRQPAGKLTVGELSEKRQELLIEAKKVLDGAVPAGVGGLVVVLGDLGWNTNKIAALLKAAWQDIRDVKTGRVWPRTNLAYERMKHLF